MTETKRLLGQRIKALRKQKNLTQEQLAESIGVDARHISRLETGAHYPSMETLEAIAGVLEKPIAEFLTFSKDKDSEDAMRFFLIDLGRMLELDELRRVVRVVRATLEKS